MSEPGPGKPPSAGDSADPAQGPVAEASARTHRTAAWLRLAELFSVFARIGLFTIGGGYAMLPLMREELVRRYGWVTDEDLLDCYAISQSTPGIIAINTATFVGYRCARTPGACFATAGMVFPSLVIIMIIATFFRQLQDIVLVQQAFAGIRIGVAVLLAFAIADLAKKAVARKVDLLLAAGAFLAVILTDISPVYVVIAAGAAGIGLSCLRKEPAG